MQKGRKRESVQTRIKRAERLFLRDVNAAWKSVTLGKKTKQRRFDMSSW